MPGWSDWVSRLSATARATRIGVVACAVLCCMWLAPARAHELIDAQSAERFLAEVDRSLATIRAKDAARARAQAHVALGRNLDDIRELLNRDIASHGKPQGLATLYLIQALQERGISLQVDARMQRIPARQAEYREALRLDPSGPASREARYRLLQGYFYDSFDADPLTPRDQGWTRLQAQIELGESYVATATQDANGEEAEFILAVHYLQAAGSAPDATARARFADKTQRAIQAFRTRHPDSMRLPALDALSERVSLAR